MRPLEWRNLTPEEIKQKIQALQRELMDLRFQHARSPVGNPRKFRMLRRDISRGMTIYREKTGRRYRNT
ncbi:MAG: 50S ribosomal protein L29 [bacterium JZ-2024 1]